MDQTYINKELDKVFLRLATLPDGWADCSDNKAFSARFLTQVKDMLNHILSDISSEKDSFFPVIAPTEPNGIDIHWKNGEFQLLINIMDTDDPSNVEIYGRKMNSSYEIEWRGKLEDLKGVIMKSLKILHKSS